MRSTIFLVVLSLIFSVPAFSGKEEEQKARDELFDNVSKNQTAVENLVSFLTSYEPNKLKSVRKALFKSTTTADYNQRIANVTLSQLMKDPSLITRFKGLIIEGGDLLSEYEETPYPSVIDTKMLKKLNFKAVKHLECDVKDLTTLQQLVSPFLDGTKFVMPAFHLGLAEAITEQNLKPYLDDLALGKLSCLARLKSLAFNADTIKAAIPLLRGFSKIESGPEINVYVHDCMSEYKFKEEERAEMEALLSTVDGACLCHIVNPHNENTYIVYEPDGFNYKELRRVSIMLPLLDKIGRGEKLSLVRALSPYQSSTLRQIVPFLIALIQKNKETQTTLDPIQVFKTAARLQPIDRDELFDEILRQPGVKYGYGDSTSILALRQLLPSQFVWKASEAIFTNDAFCHGIKPELDRLIHRLKKIKRDDRPIAIEKATTWLNQRKEAKPAPPKIGRTGHRLYELGLVIETLSHFKPMQWDKMLSVPYIGYQSGPYDAVYHLMCASFTETEKDRDDVFQYMGALQPAGEIYLENPIEYIKILAKQTGKKSFLRIADRQLVYEQLRDIKRVFHIHSDDPLQLSQPIYKALADLPPNELKSKLEQVKDLIELCQDKLRKEIESRDTGLKKFNQNYAKNLSLEYDEVSLADLLSFFVEHSTEDIEFLLHYLGSLHHIIAPEANRKLAAEMKFDIEGLKGITVGDQCRIIVNMKPYLKGHQKAAPEWLVLNQVKDNRLMRHLNRYSTDAQKSPAITAQEMRMMAIEGEDLSELEFLSRLSVAVADDAQDK